MAEGERRRSSRSLKATGHLLMISSVEGSDRSRFQPSGNFSPDSFPSSEPERASMRFKSSMPYKTDLSIVMVPASRIGIKESTATPGLHSSSGPARTYFRRLKNGSRLHMSWHKCTRFVLMPILGMLPGDKYRGDYGEALVRPMRPLVGEFVGKPQDVCVAPAAAVEWRPGFPAYSTPLALHSSSPHSLLHVFLF